MIHFSFTLTPWEGVYSDYRLTFNGSKGNVTYGVRCEKSVKKFTLYVRLIWRRSVAKYLLQRAEVFQVFGLCVACGGDSCL